MGDLFNDAVRKAIELRRQLHQIPERSFHETNTKSLLITFLKSETDFEIEDRGPWFYAVKKAQNPIYSPIAFRADMDAVCQTGAEPGHFCGHDGHCSLIAGLAAALSKQQLNRDIYLIFQPAEEIGQGATLCRELLKQNGISEIYGMHNIPGYPQNTILLRNHTFALASTGLSIRMIGKPSHAAYPEAGNNPALALARLALEIERLTDQINMDGKGLVRMTVVGADIGSDSYGMSASDGTLRLTVRGEPERLFTDYLQNIRTLAQQTANHDHFILEINEIERFPATENNPDCTDRLRNAAKRLGLSVIDLPEPMRWSEDFGYYLQETPGAFFGIGDGETYPQLHTSDFVFPDEIIETGIRLFAELLGG